MKILLINQEHAHFSGPGGAERSVQSIAEHFAASGHQATFVAMTRKVYQRDMPESGIHSIRDINGVRTIMVGKTSQFPTHADLLRPIVLSEAPDIIHTNVFHRAPQLWEALSPLGIPMLHTLREYKLMCERNLFDGVRDCGEPCGPCAIALDHARQMSRHVDGVVGISKFTLHRHLNHGFFPNAGLKLVIPNSYRPKEPPAPRVWRQPGTPPRIGFLGRMHASKGINLIIDAFSAIDPSVASLVMAGDLQDEGIAERVRQLGETHNARYIGFTDPVGFFQDIDILLAPSVWHEPFGRITIEAFAHGVPVITTDRGGLPDIVTDGQTGWIFSPDHVEQLTAILNGLRTLTDAELERMSQNCLVAAKNYTPQVVGDAYLDAYRQVIATKRETVSRTVVALREVHRRDARRRQVAQRMRTNKPQRDRRPMKILIVAGEFPKLSETFILNHVTGLLDLGHDVRVLHTSHGRPDQMPRDYLTRRLQDRSFSVLPPDNWRQAIQQLARPARVAASRLATAGKAVGNLALNLDQAVLEAQTELEATDAKLLDLFAARAIEQHAADVDVVHCHFGHRPKTMFKYLDMGAFSAPIVCSFHGIDMSAHIQSKGPTLYDDVKRRLAKALPISNFFRQRLIGLGFEPKDVQVHRVGIDCSKFAFARRQREAGEPLRLVSVGRLVAKKGFEFGIRAVAKALELRPGLNVEYDIAGEGKDGDQLRQLVLELGVGERVRLLGAQPHHVVTDLMARGHALLAPSVTGADGDMEGIPTVTMEAMATGLPVLSTFHSGIPEAVVDGYTGFLAPERDSEVLARYILHLHDNPELGPKLGRQGRAHVLLEFNIDRQNLKALDLYERIVSGVED